MPKFTLEVIAWLPNVATVVVDAEDLEAACEEAINLVDSGDVELDSDLEKGTYTKIAAAALGEHRSAYSPDDEQLKIPRHYRDPVQGLSGLYLYPFEIKRRRPLRLASVIALSTPHSSHQGPAIPKTPAKSDPP
jgi:hypothetical protein